MRGNDVGLWLLRPGTRFGADRLPTMARTAASGEPPGRGGMWPPESGRDDGGCGEGSLLPEGVAVPSGVDVPSERPDRGRRD
mmetsp:Transcript_128722/g.257089  ORF Transcript_128722/g.257089 Transcript_128722/m.257089 type:complete len:82 (-) Transcript_128722:508-753(-)